MESIGIIFIPYQNKKYNFELKTKNIIKFIKYYNEHVSIGNSIKTVSTKDTKDGTVIEIESKYSFTKTRQELIELVNSYVNINNLAPISISYINNFDVAKIFTNITYSNKDDDDDIERNINQELEDFLNTFTKTNNTDLKKLKKLMFNATYNKKTNFLIFEIDIKLYEMMINHFIKINEIDQLNDPKYIEMKLFQSNNHAYNEYGYVCNKCKKIHSSFYQYKLENECHFICPNCNISSMKEHEINKKCINRINYCNLCFVNKNMKNTHEKNSLCPVRINVFNQFVFHNRNKAMENIQKSINKTKPKEYKINNDSYPPLTNKKNYAKILSESNQKKDVINISTNSDSEETEEANVNKASRISNTSKNSKTPMDSNLTSNTTSITTSNISGEYSDYEESLESDGESRESIKSSNSNKHNTNFDIDSPTNSHTSNHLVKTNNSDDTQTNSPLKTYISVNELENKLARLNDQIKPENSNFNPIDHFEIEKSQCSSTNTFDNKHNNTPSLLDEDYESKNGDFKLYLETGLKSFIEVFIDDSNHQFVFKIPTHWAKAKGFNFSVTLEDGSTVSVNHGHK